MRWGTELLLVGCLAVISVGGCGREAELERNREASSRTLAETVPRTDGPLVIFLGDSLTAGYGLSEEEAFPALLSRRLESGGHAARIVNAGVSGDTTAGGLARLDWLLSQQPDVMVVELGANDGLRGLALEETKQNLDEIIRRCLGAEARVLLLGMRIPPSYGPDYTDRFAAQFEELSNLHGITLMPFLLEGVAADPDLNQEDGIHPNRAGHRLLARSVEPYLVEILAGL